MTLHLPSLANSSVEWVTVIPTSKTVNWEAERVEGEPEVDYVWDKHFDMLLSRWAGKTCGGPSC